MKRKIDKIKNKRLVMGGSINNLSPNEILVEQKGDTISLKERINGEIKEVSGNSNESNGYVYYDLRNASFEAKTMFLSYCALMVRFDGADKYTIPPLGIGGEGLDETYVNKTLAAMTDLELEIDMGEGLIKVRDVISMGGMSFPEITKEQFYSLE